MESEGLDSCFREIEKHANVGVHAFINVTCKFKISIQLLLFPSLSSFLNFPNRSLFSLNVNFRNHQSPSLYALWECARSDVIAK